MCGSRTVRQSAPLRRNGRHAARQAKKFSSTQTKCLDVPVLCGGQILTLKRRGEACETTPLRRMEEKT